MYFLSSILNKDYEEQFFIIVIVIGIIVCITIVQYLSNFYDYDNVLIQRSLPNNQTTVVYDVPSKIWIANNTIYRESEINNKSNIVTMPANEILFSHKYLVDENKVKILSVISSDPMNYKIYQKIGLFNTSKNVVFVYPIFTQAAYGARGFYDYYRKSCDSECFTVQIPEVQLGKYTSSIRGYCNLVHIELFLYN